MKSFDGYLKQTAGDTSLLLAGGGTKPLSDFLFPSDADNLYLKKAGDTMSGPIYFENTLNLNPWIFCNNLELSMTWNYSKREGAGFSAYNANVASTSDKGVFYAWADNGTNRVHLKGFPNGHLTWNNYEIITEANAFTELSINKLEGLKITVGGITRTIPISTLNQLFGVPYDYTLNYIASTGSQYIDSGWCIDYGAGFEITAEYEFSSSGSRGCPWSDHNCSHSLSLEVQGNYSRMYFDSGQIDDNRYVAPDTKHTSIFRYQNGIVEHVVDGTTYLSTSYSITGTNPHSGFIFVDRAMRFSTFNKTFKLYSLKIKQGNNLVRYFIPVCVNNTGYLYDTVNKLLYGNLGSGQFLMG